MDAAEVFAPGEFLKEEIEARGWSQVELAEILGRPPKVVNEIIAGKKAITPETAIQLGEALGTGPELWMNLESQYQLSKVAVSNVIPRRAALYSKFPVREMIKRGWIEASENVQLLEQQFLRFFNIESFDEKPFFAHAAKRSRANEDIELSQLAWLIRARAIAATTISKKFEATRTESMLDHLATLRTAPEEVRLVPKVLGDCGIRLVYVEALAGSHIDGACFWLNETQPVIAMSLRLDRIDNFWFVLRHELEHVRLGHGQKNGFILDVDIDSPTTIEVAKEEKLANDAAAEFCCSQAQLNDFVARVSPYFSEEKIILFSRRLGIHPGLVAGQLRRKLGRYDRWSSHLAKVRLIAIKSAPVDGWGMVENL
ncbi:HigA family addiction module antitoxin [Polaromonas sp. AET17H-212]|uniref:HigA family addiction module antitoxin n=1 Tax=Polaromonas sp. AET17H-212 TaxID=1977061 RepID=UPI000BBBC74C|nr:HigA family addiction module antitoxin [Polaromonas sp. AET17H-212]